MSIRKDQNSAKALVLKRIFGLSRSQLEAMNKLKAQDFVALLKYFDGTEYTGYNRPDRATLKNISQEEMEVFDKKFTRERFEKNDSLLKELNLEETYKLHHSKVSFLYGLMKPGILSYTKDTWDMHDIFFQELNEKYFLVEDKDRIEWHDKEFPFGEALTKDHLEIKEPAIEMGKAVAFKHPYSVIFLSLGVVEIFVRKFALKFGVEKVEQKEWGTILGEIDPILLKWKGKNLTRYRLLADDCSAIFSRLDHLNRGYRRKIAHLRKNYDMRIAQEIFESSKEIVEELNRLLNKRGFLKHA